MGVLLPSCVEYIHSHHRHPYRGLLLHIFQTRRAISIPTLVPIIFSSMSIYVSAVLYSFQMSLPGSRLSFLQGGRWAGADSYDTYNCPGTCNGKLLYLRYIC